MLSTKRYARRNIASAYSLSLSRQKVPSPLIPCTNFTIASFGVSIVKHLTRSPIRKDHIRLQRKKWYYRLIQKFQSEDAFQAQTTDPGT